MPTNVRDEDFLILEMLQGISLTASTGVYLAVRLEERTGGIDCVESRWCSMHECTGIVNENRSSAYLAPCSKRTPFICSVVPSFLPRW
jgi:hypothetical protein